MKQASFGIEWYVNRSKKAESANRGSIAWKESKVNKNAYCTKMAGKEVCGGRGRVISDVNVGNYVSFFQYIWTLHTVPDMTTLSSSTG